jgi:hypothetical protein
MRLKMENVGIFYVYWVIFIAIWYVLWHFGIFVEFWYIFPDSVGCTKKNLATLLEREKKAFFPQNKSPNRVAVIRGKRRISIMTAAFDILDFFLNRFIAHFCGTHYAKNICMWGLKLRCYCKKNEKKLCLHGWGRCYDHNFLRFLTIFGEKFGFLS